MTLYTLKETLSDRIKLLKAILDQTERIQERGAPLNLTPHNLGYVKGRLEEARVIFRLVDRVATDMATRKQEREDHSLPYVSVDEIDDDPDRYDPSRC